MYLKLVHKVWRSRVFPVENVVNFCHSCRQACFLQDSLMMANNYLHTASSDMPDDMNYYQLSKQDMLDFFEKIKFSTLEERLAIPGMHPMRAEWMVIALIEIIKTIEYFSVNEIWYVSHSLKEGAVYDWIDQHC